MIAGRTKEHNDYRDVVIIGGGFAGPAVATSRQRQGHRCLIVESLTFPRSRIGESLIPHTHGTSVRLGLLPKRGATHFPVKHSVRCISPSGHEESLFYFSETIKGDRARTWQEQCFEFGQIGLDSDVVGKDMSSFLRPLAQRTSAPEPLHPEMGHLTS